MSIRRCVERTPANICQREDLTSICLNTAGLVNLATLSESTGIDRRTARAYDLLLENLLVTEQIPAWWTNRIKRLVQSPKRYVIDSGLVGATLGLDRQGVRKDGNILGRLLDTFVMSQLRAEAAAAAARPRLFHLRTHGGRNEIDLIAEYEDGRVFGIEIKAGSAPTPRDARHLRWLADELDDQFIGGAVLHTGPRRYRLDDQIVAAPISALWAP